MAISIKVVTPYVTLEAENIQTRTSDLDVIKEVIKRAADESIRIQNSQTND